MMQPTIGRKLKEAREAQDISLEELSLATHIKLGYLRAMEAGQFDQLPSPVQQKGFLRAYALHVGLEPDPLLDSLTGQSGEKTGVGSRVEGAEAAGGAEKRGDIPAADPSNLETSPEEDAGEEIMYELGSRLRSQRESLGLALRRIEDQIHIPIRYLQALERGHLEDLPSTVQGRGMLKNYAEFLGLEPEQLLLRYADVLQERLKATRPPEKRTPRRGISFGKRLQRFFLRPTLTVLLVVILVGAALIWSGIQVFGNDGQELDTTPTIPGVAQVLLPSSTFTITPTPALTGTASGISSAVEDEALTVTPEASQDTPQPTLPPPGDIGVQLQLIITQRTFMRILVDGEEVFNGRMLPGSVHVYNGEERIELTTGNAGGVEVIYNQRDLGLLGLYGEVVSRIFTDEGIATATPTITPTPTETLTPTITPTPSGTSALEEPE